MAKGSGEQNTRKLSPKRARNALTHAIRVKRPVFLWGPPGIGKSEVVEQIARDAGMGFIDVRLSLWEPTDIKGIPYFDSTNEKMVWAPPVELPDAEMAAQHPKGIVLFLDEMNSAPPAVQGAAYSLILNRRVGTYFLPDNVAIIAAGNREGDKGITYRQPAPLANRFIHLEMESVYDEWFEWAVNNNIHKDVVGFVTFSKGSLNTFSSDQSTRAFATPRTWTFVSDVLADDQVNEDVAFDLIAGSIGEGLAISFMAHRRVAGMMPNPRDILLGKVKEMPKNKSGDANTEISACYSLTISLCYELKEASEKDSDDDFNKKFDNFMAFSMNNFESEMVVMGVKVALSQYNLSPDPDKCAHFDKFHEKYGKYIQMASSVR